MGNVNRPSRDVVTAGTTQGVEHTLWRPHWERSDAENHLLFSLCGPHSFIQHHRPQFLARGGEHIVYLSEANPTHVVKVDTEWISSYPQRIDYERELLAAAQAKQSSWDTLAQHFGLAATLDTHVTVDTFPLSRGAIFEIFKGSQPKLPKEIKTLVLIQRTAPALQDSLTLSVASGYLEDNAELSPSEYKLFSKVLLSGDERDFNPSQFTTLYGQRGVSAVLSHATDIPAVRACLSDFITKACHYSHVTGLTLDLAGRCNVAIVPDEGTWTYLIPDALAPGTENTLPHAAELLTQFQGGARLSRKQRYVLMNVLHYVRIMNGISMTCGLESRLAIPGIDISGLSAHLPKLLAEIRERKQTT